jgi:spore coat protein H
MLVVARNRFAVCCAGLVVSFATALSLLAQAPPTAAAKADVAKADAKKDGTKKEDKTKKLFEGRIVPSFRIEIAPPEMQKLRAEPRKYAKAQIKVTTPDGEKTFKDVAIHLKGAAGSFRGVDDRPAMTVNLDKFTKDQEFYDLDKFHLNNSVQDGSYVNEMLSGELNLAGGVPTARATHARVWLNNKELGFYVLKESYDKKFLKRHFGDDTGNLYDGGFCQEIDANLEKDSGNGVNDKSDLKALVAACREGDLAKRKDALEKILDIDQFCRFMAMELLCCHWDGYNRNRNNYRIYFNPKNGGRAAFIPHGMDQMFGDPNFDIINGGALVSNAVLGVPDFRARYRDILQEKSALFVPADKLLEQIEAHRTHLMAVVKEFNPGQSNDIGNQINGLKDRIHQRAVSVARQTGQADPRPLKFDDKKTAQLKGWEIRKETEDATVDKVANDRGLHIATGASKRVVASWRTKVLLAAGKYRLEAKVKTENVAALQDQSGSGAGVRLSGGGRTNAQDGTKDWTTLTHPFEVAQPTQEVELVLELRATAGQAWFDTQHLVLVKE